MWKLVLGIVLGAAVIVAVVGWAIHSTGENISKDIDGKSS